MGQSSIIYPMLDGKREKRIPVCTERLLYGESEYFFSPRFKKSDEVIEGILRGYITRSKLKNLFSSELKVKLVFQEDKKASKEIREIISELNQEVDLAYDDVVAYFKNGRFTVLLTSERVISNYMRDDNGMYINCLIKNVHVTNETTMMEEDGIQFRFDREFSDDFIGLFMELKDLNKEIELLQENHPLNSEKREVRENYLAILVDKSLADGSLSSNEVIRLEILARQMGIDSLTVLGQIARAISQYEKYKNNPERYIDESLERLKDISVKYYYMLYHDVITFELLSNKGEVVEQMSEFSELLSRRCGINKEFKDSYAKAMQKLVVSSYSLRDTMQKMGNRIENREAFYKLFDSMEYEYNLQKELLK